MGYATQQAAVEASGRRVGTTTWGLLESQGKIPGTPRVQRAICDVLRWPSDALRLLEEGRPVTGLPRPLTVSPSQNPLAEHVEELQRRMDLQDAAIEGLAAGLKDLRGRVLRLDRRRGSTGVG